ncbi:MAG TPA: acetylxylan esterase, partial [Burkholderiales bacterium]|nr:acetylxylan esterase [Burkholderiales bacterium]
APGTLPPPNVTIIPATNTATITPLPSPTQTTLQALYPYTVDGLRQHDFTNGKVHIREKLDETDVYTRYLIDYPSDGLTITGIMQIPVEGHAPFPVILMNHGFFARSVYASGDGTDRAAGYFNRHGYLTLSSDYRSWGGSDAGPSLYYSGLAIDVINLLNAVSSIPEADASRVGIWGHSMGGGVTMKVLTIESRLKAAVLYSTVSADDADVLARWGLGCFGSVEEGERQIGCNSSDVLPFSLPAELLRAYYDASTDARLLEKISPIHNLELVNAPVQINYGTDDGKTNAGTPPEWSKKLYAALLEAGKPAELFGYEGEAHSFVGDAWVAVMERSAHFFDKYVKYAE